MDEKGLGKRLQTARQAAGMTQQVLCQKANLSYSTLAKIERGAIKSPSIFTIQSIAGALNMSLDALLGSPVTAPIPQRDYLQTKSGVKFVYFDINGCLVRYYQRGFTKLAEMSGAPADVVETAFWHYNDDVCRGAMTLDEFNTVLAERLGTMVDWRQIYLDSVEAITAMHEQLVWAAERYRVGLLSNVMPGFIDAMRSRGLLPDIDYAAIVDSSVIGAIKPDDRIFEVALERSGCAPSEILLIDDTRGNLMAAERRGWHVLIFDDFSIEDSLERVKSALEPA